MLEVEICIDVKPKIFLASIPKVDSLVFRWYFVSSFSRGLRCIPHTNRYVHLAHTLKKTLLHLQIILICNIFNIHFMEVVHAT